MSISSHTHSGDKNLVSTGGLDNAIMQWRIVSDSAAGTSQVRMLQTSKAWLVTLHVQAAVGDADPYADGF